MEVKLDNNPFYIQANLDSQLYFAILNKLNLFESKEKLINYTGNRIPSSYC